MLLLYTIMGVFYGRGGLVDSTLGQTGEVACLNSGMYQLV